jgi:polar amino acid transport system substrate-binding protein
MIATVFVLLAVGTGVNLYSTFKPKQSTIVTAKDAEAEMRTIPHDYKIHLLTENFPPFNMAMTKNNTFKTFSSERGITGIGADTVREMMKRAGIRYEMTLRFPWSRIYKMTEEGKGFGLFVTTRTPERENSFKWVGPIADTSMVLIAKPGSDLKLTKIDQAANLTIGGYAGDSVAETLKGMGFMVKEAVEDTTNIQKLMDGEIDVWATTDPVGPYFAKTKGYPNLPVVLRFRTSQVYLALNKETPDIVITEMQKAFDSMRDDGTLAQITRKYL